MSLPDELKNLADLRKNGALTEKEFTDAKARLIEADGGAKKKKTTMGWLLIIFGILVGILVLTGPTKGQSASELLGELTFPVIIIALGCYYAGFIRKAI